MTWRFMTSKDIQTVMDISNEVWGTDYFEGIETFSNKLKYFPAGCKMYDNHGYLFSHPWTLYSPPRLDEPLVTTYHIHDIALLPSVRNRGLCSGIMEEVLSNYSVVTLVAANNTESFWQRFGFEILSEENYGKYMVWHQSHQEKI